MKYNILLLFIALIFTIPSLAQKEAAIWYFGVKAGLDFNSGSPVALTNGKLSTAEGCTTISDKDGNLLFYTDGSTVYDKSHKEMPNGFGLLGHNSSTQSAIIVPKPNAPNLYYIFTVDEPNPKNADDNPLNDENAPNNGLNYSLVDLSLNNGLGDISEQDKNIHLITYNKDDSDEIKYKCSEKITAVQHADGVSFWVITHFKNNFYAFKISNKGVEKEPVKTTTFNIPTGGYNGNAVGYLKSSPNGKKLAMANSSIRRTNDYGPKGNIIRNTGNVLLYDFNSDTGVLENETILMNGTNPYGVEFSARTKKLYITTNNFDDQGVSQGSSLIQYDLKTSNINNSKAIIYNSANVAGALQLAIDEKIYRSGYLLADGSDKLSVINNPELDGTNCNYIQNKIDLNGKFAKLGLPPFITSLFLYTFNYEFNCFGNSTHFFVNTTEKIDGYLWNFGDGTTSTDKDAYHTYAKTGDYKVTLIKTVNGELKEPLEKTITIYESPKVLPTPYKLIQCDTQDTEPTDGLSTFNLSLANEAICLGNKDLNVYYYHSRLDAENDINNTQSIQNTYRNNVPDEILYAKVAHPNSTCFNIGSVILHANKNISLSPEPMHSCDIGDGTAIFDLDIKSENIKIELNLPADLRLHFYSTEIDSQLGLNSLIGKYNSSSKTIYIRAENDEGCYGTGKFDFFVESVPQFNTLEHKTVCEGDTNSIILEPKIIDPETINNYTYSWSTSETTPTIYVNKEGDYSVIIKNKANCTTTVDFKVALSYLARINDIKIDDLKSQNQIIIDVKNPTDYKYLIQLQNGVATTFQNQPVFQNIPGGIHELVIESNNGCGQIMKVITVLEAPFFFTPNGDGFNDFWNIKGINDTSFNKGTRIYIYDRYGKLLKQLSPSDNGWDGTYTGNSMPADDYWYSIKLEDGREAKGHFSLKR